MTVHIQVGAAKRQAAAPPPIGDAQDRCDVRDARLLTLADSDRRLQAYYVRNLHVITLAGEPAELAHGVVALVGLLFAEATADDAAAVKLWCPLTVRELANRLGVARSTVERRLAAAVAHGLMIEAPFPGHRRKLRRRPCWDAIAGMVNAAAWAGRIPGPPLFEEAVETGHLVPAGGTTPQPAPTCPDHRDTLSPPAGQLSDVAQKNLEKNRGGVRGGSTPFGGGAPLTPAPSGQKDKTKETSCPADGDNFDRDNFRQFALDFQRRTEARLEALALGQSELLQGQRQACGLLNELRIEIRQALAAEMAGTRDGGTVRKKKMPSQNSDTSRYSEAVKKAAGNDQIDRGRQIIDWLSLLPADEREAFLLGCARRLRPGAAPYEVNTGLLRGVSSTVEVAWHLQAHWQVERPAALAALQAAAEVPRERAREQQALEDAVGALFDALDRGERERIATKVLGRDSVAWRLFCQRPRAHGYVRTKLLQAFAREEAGTVEGNSVRDSAGGKANV